MALMFPIARPQGNLNDLELVSHTFNIEGSIRGGIIFILFLKALVFKFAIYRDRNQKKDFVKIRAH